MRPVNVKRARTPGSPGRPRQRGASETLAAESLSLARACAASGTGSPAGAPLGGGLWVPVPACPPRIPASPGKGGGSTLPQGDRPAREDTLPRAQGLATLPFTEAVTRPSLWPSVPSPTSWHMLGEPWQLTHRHRGGQGTGGVGAQSPCPKTPTGSCSKHYRGVRPPRQRALGTGMSGTDRRGQPPSRLHLTGPQNRVPAPHR